MFAGGEIDSKSCDPQRRGNTAVLRITSKWYVLNLDSGETINSEMPRVTIITITTYCILHL